MMDAGEVDRLITSLCDQITFTTAMLDIMSRYFAASEASIKAPGDLAARRTMRNCREEMSLLLLSEPERNSVE